ncbi:MAG: hypothetical protein C0423_08605 [Methylibium sp.]|nr:hypothetical protein [Methylibium sp.]
MLDWKNLTARQRITSVFFALFLVLAWALRWWSSADAERATSQELLALVAVTALMLAMLLNPDAVRGSMRAMNPLAVPTVCKALCAGGIIALLVRAVLGIVA